MRAIGIRPPATVVAGFKVQTSVYGTPITIVYGVARIAGNLLHMPADPVPTGSGGGKSGFGSKGAAGGQNYQAALAIGLCEGPIVKIDKVWRDKDTAVGFTTNYAPAGWSLFLGTSTQSPWSYLTTAFPAQAVPYQFTAYVANVAAVLPNDSLSQYGWEVHGFLSFGGGVVDASPADIIVDFLTNAEYGVGFDSSRIAANASFADYCAAAGLFVSPVYDSVQPARDHLNELFEVSNSAPVWSDGVLKIIPYGDTPLSGNGHTYTPNTTPLYNLGDNDFLPNSAADLAGSDAGPETTGGSFDPIAVTRVDPAKAYNKITVEFEDSTFGYNTATAKAEDQDAITQYGPIPMQTLALHSIKLLDVARTVAQIRLQREQHVRNTYTFLLGWQYSLLEPMDLVTLTDVGLGYADLPVRITAIEDLESEQGYSVTAEDWPFGVATAALYDSGSANGFSPNTNVDPGNTINPVIFEGPSALQSAPLEIWIGASGGPDWGGCEVWVSIDNVTFEKVGQINGKSTFGVTTASIATNAAYPTIDTTHTLSVNTSASGQQLVAQSNTAFTNLIPLCYLGGEFVAYRDLTLTSALHYDLTHLYRGLYGSTIPGSHGAGTAFVFCDTTILVLPWPQGAIGQVLYFKFPAFNAYGAALQDVATVSSVSHTIGRDPIIPGEAGEQAISQGTVSIDANGNWGWTVDIPGAWLQPSSIQSLKWAASIAGFPSDATVSASGAIITPASGIHTASVASGGAISLGQTIYISMLFYSGGSGTGSIIETIHIQGSYLTLSASKTANYPASGAIFINSTPGDPWFYDSNGILNGATTTPATVADFRQFFAIPGGTSGVTLTQFAVTVYSGVTSTTGPDVFIERMSGSTQVGIGSHSATVGAGYQSLVMSMSENTSGRGYAVHVQMDVAGFTADQRYASTAITYTMPDSKQTM